MKPIGARTKAVRRQRIYAVPGAKARDRFSCCVRAKFIRKPIWSLPPRSTDALHSIIRHAADFRPVHAANVLGDQPSHFFGIGREHEMGSSADCDDRERRLIGL
jgi:hypothetical protein